MTQDTTPTAASSVAQRKCNNNAKQQCQETKQTKKQYSPERELRSWQEWTLLRRCADVVAMQTV